MRKFFSMAALAALLLGTAGLAPAQNDNYESRKLPLSMLKQLSPRSAQSREKFAAFGTHKRLAASRIRNFATSGLPGVDSVVNWSDSFTEPGFDDAGNPQSVWPYTMVGNPPESGRTTFFNAPVIPVVLDLLLPNGAIAVSFSAAGKDSRAAIGSPVFQPFIYNGGIGQFDDELMRNEFWERIHPNAHGPDNGWHNVLMPRVKSTRHMRVPFFTATGGRAWFVFVDANGNPVLAAVDGNTFVNLLFPSTVPVDNSTVIGAAELAGDMTTRDITTLLFDNLALFDGDISQCCTLGFHSYDFEPGDASNGNRDRRFVMNFSSWLSPGLFFFGFEDASTLSHEMSETFNDPFVNNATPWWENVDPFAGFGICQNNLETGDVIEVLTTLPVYTASYGGQTYHLQNEAMFSWFAFQSPSQARNGSYSFPDETTQTTLSPSGLLPGCVPSGP